MLEQELGAEKENIPIPWGGEIKRLRMACPDGREENIILKDVQQRQIPLDGMGQQAQVGEQGPLGAAAGRKSIDIDRISKSVRLEERFEILRLGIDRRPDRRLGEPGCPEPIEQALTAIGAALQIDTKSGSALKLIPFQTGTFCRLLILRDCDPVGNGFWGGRGLRRCGPAKNRPPFIPEIDRNTASRIGPYLDQAGHPSGDYRRQYRDQSIAWQRSRGPWHFDQASIP